VAVAWDKAAVEDKEVDKVVVADKGADEVWVVEVDEVWAEEAVLLVPAASASVPIAVRPFRISKVYLALR
jgi:hypothetical protein